MKRLLILILPLLALWILTSDPGAAGGQHAAAPDPRFGLVDAFWLPDEAADLNVGWERILFYWREIQPTGPDDWNTLHVREEWLAQANTHGRTVVGLLKNTAPWASLDGTEAGVPRGLYLPLDDPDNLWANFVRRIARYYGVRNVHHWIIWNEPEIRSDVYGYEFAGSINDYYQLLKVAYTVMKQEDPEAVIHLAGLTWWHDQTYLRRLLELIKRDPEAEANNHFFDVISLHIYFRSETVETIVQEVKGIEADLGFDKPIWINETNAPPNHDPLWPVNRPNFDVDPDQQSWFVTQSLALGFASGVERVGVYKLLDVRLPSGGESFGILRPDLSRRPAFYAYKTAIEYLRDFTAVERQQFDDYYVIAFARPRGVTRVAWARTARDVSLELPALANSALSINPVGRSAKVSAVDGRYRIELTGAICSGECLIGGPPVLLFEEGATLNPESPPAVDAQGGGPLPPEQVYSLPMDTPTVELSPEPTFSTRRPAAPTQTASATPEAPSGPIDGPTAPPAISRLSTPTVEPPNALTFEESPDQAAVERAARPWDVAGLWFLVAAIGLSGFLLVVIRRMRSS